jgi:Domain of unknown function (DUF5666)
MKKQIALFSLVAAAMIGTPAILQAQDAAKPEAAAPAASEGKQGHMLRGKVTAVDTTANTLTIKDQTVNTTSETKILKGKTPATLADIKAGDLVGVTYKKSADGKINATIIHIGGGKKKEKAE